MEGIFFAVLRIRGRVKRDKDDIFRVVNGRDADKGDDLVLDLIAVLVVFVQLFGRAGLAADTVAGGFGRRSRALGDDLFHKAAHCFGRLLADDLPQDGLFVPLDHVAIGVQNLAHDIRLEHIAAVDDRRDGAYQLHGRDTEALTERGRDEIGCAVLCGIVQVFPFVEQTAGLARQINACFFHDAEGLEVIIENIAAHAQADMAKGDVAGIAERLRGRLRTVTGGFPAVKDLLTAGELFLTAAVERVVQRDGSGIDCGGQRDEFEGRTRLIAVGHAAVAPLSHTCRCNILLILLDGGLIGIGRFRQGQRRITLIFKKRGRRVVIDFQIIIWIIGAERGHGLDLARVHVHDDTERAIFDIVLINGVLQVLFHIRLHGRVDGGNEAAAVRGVIVFFVCIGHLGAVVALGCHDLPGCAGKLFVVIGFKALGAVVVA